MNLNQMLGLRVKEARKRLGMSQQELGELLEVEHAQIISQIESGERQVKAWELARLSAILHTSITDLLKEETLPEPVVLWREQPDKNYQKIETEFVQHSQLRLSRETVRCAIEISATARGYSRRKA